MDRSRIAIIIPAFNEEDTMEAVIASALLYGSPIVVDDGSSDATAKIAKAAGAQVVQHAFNQGYDRALRSGFSAASRLECEYAITMDADGQHNPVQLDHFITQLCAGCDLVLGVRDNTQRVAEAVFAKAGKALWGITDPLCGMKGYAMAAYNRVGSFGSFKSIGTELAVRIIAQGGTFYEIPVRTRERNDRPRFGNIFSANFKILCALIMLFYLHVTRQLKRPIYES